MPSKTDVTREKFGLAVFTHIYTQMGSNGVGNCAGLYCVASNIVDRVK